MKRYEVIVGNIGSVLQTNDYKEAKATYKEYVQQSKENYGRAAGEVVTLFDNKTDDVDCEYEPVISFRNNIPL